MKFVSLHVSVGVERLRIAINGDVERGSVTRSEGAVRMQLMDPVLSVECAEVDFGQIHPDVLALIAVLAFHPVLPSDDFELRLPFPVSENVEAALRRPHILPGVRVRGEGHVAAYQPKIESVLSYGGGFDSLAAHLLFPDVPLVHETPLPSRRGKYTDVVNDIMDGFDTSTYKVFDNLRQLFSAWGLPLWVSVYVAALVLEPRYVLSGSEMTGTYLLGGQKYHPRYKNLWYSVFSGIGIRVLPTSFLSEVGNAQIVGRRGRMADAAYCAFIDRKDCNKCTKCLRRRMLRGAVNPEDLVLVDSFVRTEAIDAFLATRPLYYGDVFLHAAAVQSRRTWVGDSLADLVGHHGPLGFHESYLPDTFDHFGYPASYRKQAEDGLAQLGLAPMSTEQRQQFTDYVQVPEGGLAANFPADRLDGAGRRSDGARRKRWWSRDVPREEPSGS